MLGKLLIFPQAANRLQIVSEREQENLVQLCESSSCLGNRLRMLLIVSCREGSNLSLYKTMGTVHRQRDWLYSWETERAVALVCVCGVPWRCNQADNYVLLNSLYTGS